ncbi:MAG: rubrerythrin family protein [Firmicutes bacterium]|nr:rubrerythrin family protein [Bacillota bacterium]
MSKVQVQPSIEKESDTLATSIPETVKLELLKAQQREITEYHIYSRLARVVKDQHNSEILQKIGDDELRHAEFWSRYTGREVQPNRFVVFFFYWLARIFGITFGIKLMEQGEERAQVNYTEIAKYIPEAERIAHEEDAHEQKLIALIDEELLNYVGSMVLGLNDALVELTGTLAGLTFALQNNKLVALSGLVTGIAASLSMAASEYLSRKSEGQSDTALTSSMYTGIAYICTVVLLILPYFVFQNHIVSLAGTLIAALLIIFCFSFYVSVVQEFNFKERFLEMAVLSMGVALISFVVGYLLQDILGVDV